MQTNIKTGLAGAALIALMLGAANPASAAATMCDTKPMASEDMKTDDMMKSDDMAKDDMAMTDDTMKSDDMAKDDMAKDDMAMADDTMKSDDTMMGSYTVMKGDSLWKIAAKTLCDGDRYPEIVAANMDMLHGSMMVHPGDMLHIPGD